MTITAQIRGERMELSWNKVLNNNEINMILISTRFLSVNMLIAIPKEATKENNKMY